MKTVLFVPADSVELYGGKFVVVGVFDTINSDKLPTILRPFSMAIKVLGEKPDHGKTYDGQIILRKVNVRKSLFELPIKLRFKKGTISTCSIAVMFPPIKFDTAGIYIFELKIGSKVLSDSKIQVVKIKTTKKKK